jgi:hypothetical protein
MDGGERLSDLLKINAYDRILTLDERLEAYHLIYVAGEEDICNVCEIIELPDPGAQIYDLDSCKYHGIYDLDLCKYHAAESLDTRTDMNVESIEAAKEEAITLLHTTDPYKNTGEGRRFEFLINILPRTEEECFVCDATRREGKEIYGMNICCGHLMYAWHRGK